MSQRQPVHSDSMESPDPDHEAPKKAKSRRPANTAFRQQRLKAWQPILTPKTVLPLFFTVGIIFAPIGGLLLYASAQVSDDRPLRARDDGTVLTNVQELIIDYSDCQTQAKFSSGNSSTDFTEIPSGKVSSSFKQSNCTSAHVPMWATHNETIQYGTDTKSTPSTVCTLQFVIPEDIGPPVLFYYRLTNFYQNHRRYVKSLDTDQLKGDAVSKSTIAGGSCDPLRLGDDDKPIYPCGLIANSLFNDSFRDLKPLNPRNTSETVYALKNTGIAWSSDKKLYGPTNYKTEDIAVPPNWAEQWPNGYTDEHPPPNLETWEEFQVWMRSAGLPNFSKLAKRNDDDALKCGTYQMEVVLNFPVTVYGGTKAIVISTRTVMGGKNPFLGIAYVVVGGICVVLGALFTVAHLIKPRKLGDHTYLTWNNDQPSTATATGVQRPGADGA
ncbi:hypothetical protein MMC07_006407 [Pseudocyphellaria aurata]|nr:hypothetical protein [Pseudocyphellaria aurata]